MSKFVQNDARDKKRIRDESVSNETVASSTRAGTTSNKRAKVATAVSTGKRGSTAVATADDDAIPASNAAIAVVSKKKGATGEKKGTTPTVAQTGGKKKGTMALPPAEEKKKVAVAPITAGGKKKKGAVASVSAVVTKKGTTASTAMTKSKAGTSSAKQSKVIYVGHIPHGFYEKELYRFFAQFGEVKRVKLFRSQKTNGSKGYAFVEFAEASIAIVAAEAMNGYFLSERQLVCNVVPPSDLHNGMFAKPKQASAVVVTENTDDGGDQDDEEDADKEVAKAKKSLAAKQKKLKAMGIEYDFLPV